MRWLNVPGLPVIATQPHLCVLSCILGRVLVALWVEVWSSGWVVCECGSMLGGHRPMAYGVRHGGEKGLLSMKSISSSRQYSLAPPQPPIACALALFLLFYVPTQANKIEVQDDLQQPCLLGPTVPFHAQQNLYFGHGGVTAIGYLCEGVKDGMEAVDMEGGNVEKEESLDGKGGLTSTGVGW